MEHNFRPPSFGTSSPFQPAPPAVNSPFKPAMPQAASSPFTPAAAGTASPFKPGAGTASPFKSAAAGGTASPFKPSSFTPSTSTLSSSPSPSRELAALPPAPAPALPADLAKYSAIPDVLPGVTPSYPAALFGGLSPDDEHVTVWEPATGKTVAGNAAPYRRNLTQWLESHAGWEEKADELKSSKRRAAARRSKNAATAFASLCAFPAAKALSSGAEARFAAAGVPAPEASLTAWAPEDYVRLQEVLVRVGQELHGRGGSSAPAPDAWQRVTQHVGGSKRPSDVVYLAHHMLERGIQKTRHELQSGGGSGAAAVAIPSSADSAGGARNGAGHSPGPASVGSYDAWRAGCGAASLPNMGTGGLSAISNSFRTPKEPRITVWHPESGKTISGNAAPCRRNLDSWMAQHPGWVPKAETQLSSARRSRAKKSRPMSIPSSAPRLGAIAIAGSASAAASLDGQSPLYEAVQGLLDLGTSVGSYNSTSGFLAGSAPGGGAGIGLPKPPQKTMLSSLSSSGAEADDEEMSLESDDDDDKMDVEE